MDPYETKFNELQKYMPFLQNMINKLKVNNNNKSSNSSRRTHLQKMEMLFELLTNKNKKLKMETLLKCENVLLKLQTKIERGAVPKPLEECKMLYNDEILDLTGPESPPPLEKNIEGNVQPVEIPIERRCSPVLTNQKNLNSYDNKSHSPNKSLLNKVMNKHESPYYKGDHNDLHHQQTFIDFAHHEKNKKSHQHRREHPRRKDNVLPILSSESFNSIKHNLSYKDVELDVAEQNYISRESHITSKCSQNMIDKKSYHDIHANSKTAERNKAYSPETVWDEYWKKNNSRSQHLSKYKWAKGRGNSVFSRLGPKDKNSNAMKSGSSLSLPMSIPARVTPIPEVLKNPPLTANDISNLLNETANDISNDSICAIGTRRCMKPQPKSNYNNPMSSSLDFVRKKFAMITKTSTTDRTELSVPTKASDYNIGPISSFQNERLALKYNPHPRVEHDHSISLNDNTHRVNKLNNCDLSKFRYSMDQFTCESSITINVNVLPTINPNDPRLKRLNIDSPPKVFSTSTKSPLLPSPPKINLSNESAESKKSVGYNKNTQSIDQLNIVHLGNPVEKFDFKSGARTQYTENIDSKDVKNVSFNSSSKNVPLDVQKRPTPTNNTCKVFSPYSAKNNRFNALLNDKSERIKYLESKKNKGNEPKTYKEFREAKAKEAAAHEKLLSQCARVCENVNKNELTSMSRDNVESKKNAHEEKSINSQKSKISSKKQNVNEEGTYFYMKKADKTIPTSNNSSTDTALDKMYRAQTFSETDIGTCKKIFKIPKKKSEMSFCESSKVKNEIPEAANKEKESSENFKTDEMLSDSNESKECISIDNTLSKVVSLKAKKFNKGDKSINKVQCMPINKNDSNINSLNLFNPMENPVSLNTINDGHAKGKSPKNVSKIIGEAIKTTNVDSTSASATISREKFSNENLQQSSKNVERIVTSNADNTIKSAVASNEDINFTVRKKQGIFARTEIVNEEKIEKTKHLRILNRRCSMVTYGSVPTVDKQKLMRTNALLFEDVQEVRRQTCFENTKNENRRSRNLEGIFKKTDDNCSVSTQNIITGKRRTRATVNFNETQNVKAIFKYKTVVDKDKKQPLISKNAKLKQSSITPYTVCNTNKDCMNETVKEGTELSKCENHVSCENVNTNDVVDINVESSIRKMGTVISNSVEEQLSEINNGIENQSNAVSSTSTEEVPMKSSKKIYKSNDNSVDDNMPSNSGNKSNSIQTKDESSRHDFLNKFVQEIFKPNDDKKHILNLLSQILDKDKFQLVKTVMESETNDMEIDSAVQARDTKGDFTNVNEKNETTNKIHELPIGQGNKVSNLNISLTKQKPIKKKRNELDRLNDDIRDMFISKGVLTATGKRMCTLMSQTKERESTIKNCQIIPKKNMKQLDIQVKEKAITKTFLMNKNSNCKGKTLRRSLRHGNTNNYANNDLHILSNEDQETLPETEPQKAILKLSTTSKFISEESLHGKSLIKLQSKQIVKSQKAMTSKEKRKRLLLKFSKVKTSKFKSGNKKCSNVQYIETKDKKNCTNEIVDYMENIKNTNINWHNQSKYINWCEICHKRLFANSNLHYKLHHGENYVSRFAPIILQKFKQGKLCNPLFGVRKFDKPFTWFYRCPFCLMYFISTLTQWFFHFQEHTAEYRHECSRCFRGSPKITTVRRHCNYKCKGAKVITTSLQNSQTKRVTAHVCHICNFVQLKRSNLQRHYLYQHNFDKNTVDLLGYTITLINTEGVNVVEEAQAAVKEAEAWEMITVKEEVIDIDEDNVEEKFEESNNEIAVTDISINLPPECNDLQDTMDINFPEFEKYNEKDLQDELLTLAAKAAEAVEEFSEMSSDEPCTIENHISCEKGEHSSLLNLINSDIPKYSKEQGCEKLLTSKKSNNSHNSTEYFQQQKGNCGDSVILSTSEKTSNSNTTQSIFITSGDFSNSPIIEANSLARNLMEIQQSPKQSMFHEGNGNSVSIAELISQRFKNVEHKSDIGNEIPNIETNMSIQNSGSSLDEQVTETNKDEDNAIFDLNGPIAEVNNDDDADWEDIEVTETSSVAPNIVSFSKLKGKNLFHKYMFKSKKTKPAFLFFDKIMNKDKVLSCNLSSITTNLPNTSNTSKKTSFQASQILQTAKEVVHCNTSFGFKPVINNIDDLLPDSPCNDPLELVPELAPLEPLQDLNDISSILNVDLGTNQQLNNELSIDAVHNQTTIEDVLDFIHGEQAQEVEKQKRCSLSNTCNKSTINRIQHLGFSILDKIEGTSYKFYCLMKPCTFLFSSDFSGLQNHISLEHADIKWNGYCGTCETQIHNNNKEYCVAMEIKHMIENHCKVEQTKEHKIEFAQELLSKDKSENGVVQEKPRIKLRRLTGDCLSALATDTYNQTQEVNKMRNTNSTLVELLNAKPQNNRTSLSPEPIVVSETVPVGQATTGNFVITQTVSAQYDGQQSREPELGINISISAANSTATSEPFQYLVNNQRETADQVTLKQFRCMGKGCKYSTRVPVAMSDHLHFHEKRNLNLHRDYLNCSFCLYCFETVDEYMEHFENHLKGRTNDLSQKASNNSNTAHNELKLLICMAKGCNYSTSAPINIEDHLRLHEKNYAPNIYKEYLECNFCAHISSNVNTYMEHVSQNHYSKKESVSCIVQEMKGQQAETTTVEKTIAQHGKAIDNDEEAYNKKLSEAIEDLVEKTGLPDSELYRCVVENCMTKLEETSFSQHVMYHISTLGLNGKDTKFYYICPHCNVQYQRPSTLKAHIKVHARCRFFCYLCNHTTSNLGAMLKHFNENHWHSLNMFTTDLLSVTFKDGQKMELPQNATFQIAYTENLDENAVREYGKKLIFNWKLKKATSKTHFTSEEIDVLPIQPIFPREINCGECEYRTKVRTNLYRHLQKHKQTAGQIGKGSVAQVAHVDPVNPVPCLSTNEKFFDKMTNLASSSVVTPYKQGGGLANTSTSTTNVCNKKSLFKNPYKYVLESNRYVCGVSDCKYVTTSDDHFRLHLLAVHESATLFRCPFCHEDVCKHSLSMERIFAHFKFHGAVLYRCGDCNYIHYLRFLVERHVNEKHYTQKVSIIKHERFNEDDAEGSCTAYVFTGYQYKEEADQTMDENIVGSENSNATKMKNKWVCSKCGHNAITMHQIQTHCFNEHGQKLQYQCIHCVFESQQLSQILHHIDDKHNGKVREARSIFYRKSNEQDEFSNIDTRPLWQRNDPKRVRHIRGILMEDEEESEKNRQKLNIVDNNDNNDYDGNQGNLIIQPYNHMNSYEFGCYYCNYKSKSVDELKTVHWSTHHNAKEEDALPFYFRLIKKFCCAECLQFTGSHEELKLHLQKQHKSRYYAADIRIAQQNITYNYPCGYCAFIAESTSQLLKHHQRKGHQPNDIFIVDNNQLHDLLKLGCNVKYVQCRVCQAMFANRTTIVTHAAECHPDVESPAFRDICNVPMYQCFTCTFATSSEINTARHMCHHYTKFKVCLFCNAPQSSFTSYMQHCYGEHRQGIQRFRDLYSFADIKKFLLQINVLLPNGLILNKRSLLNSQYGSIEFMRYVYEELYKISQQPPIPRLSLGRLVAKIGQESKSSQQPKKIEKRRCTIAAELNEEDLKWAMPKSNQICSTDTIQKRNEIESISSIPSLIAKTGQESKSPQQPKKIEKRRCTIAAGLNEKDLPKWVIPKSNQICSTDTIQKRNEIESISSIPSLVAKAGQESKSSQQSKKIEKQRCTIAVELNEEDLKWAMPKSNQICSTDTIQKRNEIESISSIPSLVAKTGQESKSSQQLKKIEKRRCTIAAGLNEKDLPKWVIPKSNQICSTDTIQKRNEIESISSIQSLVAKAGQESKSSQQSKKKEKRRCTIAAELNEEDLKWAMPKSNKICNTDTTQKRNENESISSIPSLVAKTGQESKSSQQLKKIEKRKCTIAAGLNEKNLLKWVIPKSNQICSTDTIQKRNEIESISSMPSLVAKAGQESKSSSQSKKIEKRRCTIAAELNEEYLQWAMPKSYEICNTYTIQKRDEIESIPRKPRQIASRRCTFSIDSKDKSLNPLASSMNSPTFPIIPTNEFRKINKRRNTTTIANNQICDNHSSMSLHYGKKRKIDNKQHAIKYYEDVDMTPYSYYGQKPDEVDLTKIFTKSAIGGLDTPVTIDKFKLLFNIEPRIVLLKYDQDYSEYKHVRKACPAREKIRFS